MSLLYPFTSSFFSFLICSQLRLFFLFKKEKRAEIQRPKMTLNPLKGSTQISIWKCQLSRSPPFPLLHAWDLFLSPILAFIFFQLRAVDSSDTVIQLYCGAATVAAVLCEGFSHVRREGKAGCHAVAEVLNSTTASKRNGSAMLCHLTTLVQTVVTFSTRQLHD